MAQEKQHLLQRIDDLTHALTSNSHHSLVEQEALTSRLRVRCSYHLISCISLIKVLQELEALVSKREKEEQIQTERIDMVHGHNLIGFISALTLTLPNSLLKRKWLWKKSRGHSKSRRESKLWNSSKLNKPFHPSSTRYVLCLPFLHHSSFFIVSWNNKMWCMNPALKS